MSLKKLLKSARFRDQLRSTVTDVLMALYVIFSGEALNLLMELYSGDYSNLTIDTLKTLVVRSVIRYCLTKGFPQFFPSPSFRPTEQSVGLSNETECSDLTLDKSK